MTNTKHSTAPQANILLVLALPFIAVILLLADFILSATLVASASALSAVTLMATIGIDKRKAKLD